MTFEDQLAQLARLRTARRRADAGLQGARKQAAAIGSRIDEVRRSGAASADEIAQLEEAARQSQQRLRDARTDLAGRVRDLSVGLDGLSTLDDPTRLIERWDDRM